MTKVVKPDDWNAAFTLVYDAWNRLVIVKDGETVVATYFYDGLNRRVKKVVGSETRLFYFNRNWQCMEEYVGSTCDTRYVWGLRYIDELVYAQWVGIPRYALQDPNWNVIAFVNSSTNAVDERYTYNSFGQANALSAAFAAKSPTTAWTRTFTAQTLDRETGFMLYRNRVYHSTLGRFVQRDPIGDEAGDMSLYRYVGNNTIIFFDPDGTVSLMQIIKHNVLPSATAPLDISGDNNKVCVSRTLPLIKVPIPALPGAFFNINIIGAFCYRACCPQSNCCPISDYEKYVDAEFTGEAFFSYGVGLKKEIKGKMRNEKVRNPYDPLGRPTKQKNIPNEPYGNDFGGGAGIGTNPPGKCPPKGCSYDGGWFIRGCAGAGFGGCVEIYGGLYDDLSINIKGGWRWGVYGVWGEGGLSFTVKCVI